MYFIGIIDDNMHELDDIRVTLCEHWNQAQLSQQSIGFKTYDVKEFTGDNVAEQLIQRLLRDITDNAIHCLIVDYKLDSWREVIEGNTIVEKLTEKVRSFPVIVLTNAPETSEKDDDIDPDKVYAKKSFINIELDTSQKMVFKIRRNVERYCNERSRLESDLAASLDAYLDPEAEKDLNLLAHITKLEDELSSYVPSDQSPVEKTIKPWDLSQLKGIIQELLQIQ